MTFSLSRYKELVEDPSVVSICVCYERCRLVLEADPSSISLAFTSYSAVRTPASLNRAKGILISGLVFQLITFGLFAVVVSLSLISIIENKISEPELTSTISSFRRSQILIFWQRCKRANVPRGPWVKLMAALGASAVLILVSSLFDASSLLQFVGS